MSAQDAFTPASRGVRIQDDLFTFYSEADRIAWYKERTYLHRLVAKGGELGGTASKLLQVNNTAARFAGRVEECLPQCTGLEEACRLTYLNLAMETPEQRPVSIATLKNELGNHWVHGKAFQNVMQLTKSATLLKNDVKPA